MDQSLKQLVAPVAKLFKQYHTTIITVIVALLLSLAIFRLYQIVIISAEKGVEGYSPTSKANGTFDQKTIDKIDNLKTPDQNGAPLKLPARQSPFVE